jgi:hypothetical protein
MMAGTGEVLAGQFLSALLLEKCQLNTTPSSSKKPGKIMPYNYILLTYLESRNLRH